jgi:hypothetical protein
MDPNELFKNLILSYWPHLIGLLVLALLAQILMSPAIKGWWGDVKFALSYTVSTPHTISAFTIYTFHELLA